MTYYEIYHQGEQWVIWKWTNNGYSATCTRFKSFKTRKGAENWARKQWDRVVWR